MAAGQASVRGGWRGAVARADALSGGLLYDPGRFLREAFAQEVERRHLFPWIPVAFGAGILLFFAADAPSLWAPALAAGLATGGAVVVRRRPVALGVCVALAAVFLGFTAGVLRVRSVAAPRLERTTILKLAGFVESVEERPEGARIVVAVQALGDLGPERMPGRVRVSSRKGKGAAPGVAAGDFIRATARLLPPPEPARPGGYDFGRDAFFRGLGGVGSLIGRIEVGSPPAPRPFWLSVATAIDGARNTVTRRIANAIGGQAGAVAAALVTGKRGLIDEDTNAALRAAGIYHVVSISGLHMVLAAGVVFWIARALLALAPAIALRWPVKKVAAVFAMAGASAYCVFAGWDIAAERSLIMVLVMLGAILVDRPALSMRNLALSALIVLAREPEGLLGPSFQMSYGAVAALIAAAGWISRHLTWGHREDFYGRALHWLSAAVLGTLGTTLVATLATGPFSAYHFQNLNPYGLIGNAVTLPLVSLVIMPGAVVGMLVYSFGLDGPVWWAMGFAVEAMLQMSRWIAGFDRSTVVVPAYGPGALSLLAAALILLTIPASALRWIGLIPAILGCWLAASAEHVDLYLDRDGAGAAVRGASGRLVLVGRSPAFVVEQWLKADGDPRSARDPRLRDGARCDPLGCVVESGREVVAFVADRRAFTEDCARATVVISRFRAPETCRARTVVDGAHLRAHGATALRWTPATPHVTSARSSGDSRPWQPKTEPPERRTIFRPPRVPASDDPPRAKDDGPPSSDEPG